MTTITKWYLKFLFHLYLLPHCMEMCISFSSSSHTFVWFQTDCSHFFDIWEKEWSIRVLYGRLKIGCREKFRQYGFYWTWKYLKWSGEKPEMCFICTQDHHIFYPRHLSVQSIQNVNCSRLTTKTRTGSASISSSMYDISCKSI